MSDSFPEPSPYIPGNLRWIVAAVALLPLIIACCLPAFYDNKGDAWVGFNVFWCGGLGLFIGQLGWFANPVAAAAILSLALVGQKTTIFLSAVAVLIALHSFQLPGTTIPLDEGMVNKVVCTNMGPGFYFWMASLGIPAVGTIIVMLVPRI